MSSSRLALRIGEVRIVGAAHVRGYAHRFNKRGKDGTAKGNMLAEGEERIWGVLYEVDEGQLRALDGFEGGYQRRTVEVVARSGDLITSWGYVGFELDDSLEPTREYLAHYVAGAREHELPEPYLRQILPSWYRL